jgi:hypothetical protein
MDYCEVSDNKIPLQIGRYIEEKTNKKKGKGEVETQGWDVCSPPYVLPSNKKKI